MPDTEPPRVLYVVACAAPAASDIQAFVSLAQDAAWRVFVIATPDALAFLNRPAIEEITGDPVRSAYRMPNDPKALPPADAVVVAPATFNTINKWATGIADNFAVALLCELTGYGVPTIAVPLSKSLSPDTPPSPETSTRSAPWASGCCSIWMRPVTGGYHPGAGS